MLISNGIHFILKTNAEAIGPSSPDGFFYESMTREQAYERFGSVRVTHCVDAFMGMQAHWMEIIARMPTGEENIDASSWLCIADDIIFTNYYAGIDAYPAITVNIEAIINEEEQEN